MLAVAVGLAAVVAQPGPAGAAGAAGTAGRSLCRRPSALSRPGPRTYRPPVRGPVVDPFRPPPQPWLPGNRGLEYATIPGTLVRAIGPGRVSFAGPVAGSLHVTVTHPDGLRSSYSFLAAVRVRRSAAVSAGAVVGVAAARLHLGVRRGRRYLDPASLWGCTVTGGRVWLVPLGGGSARRVRSAPGVLGAAPRHRYTRSSARHRGGPSPPPPGSSHGRRPSPAGAALRIRVSHNRWEERAACPSP